MSAMAIACINGIIVRSSIVFSGIAVANKVMAKSNTASWTITATKSRVSIVDA
jgi:hypothetical protein